MKLGDRLKELRNERGYTLRELANKIGDISPTYLSDIENNRNDPSLKKLQLIADALDVSTAYLLDLYDKNNGGNDKFKLEQTEFIKKTETTKIPIIGKIAGGAPIFAEENIEGYKTVPKNSVANGKHFLLRVSGDSMINAGIFENDLVMIRQQPTCETGEIAAVLVEDKKMATLKRVYIKNGSVLLQPENPKYSSEMYDAEEVDIVGKAIQVIREL